MNRPKLTQLKKLKKLPAPAFALLVSGLTVFRREGKHELQPAGWELYKAGFLPSWEEPSARKGNKEVCFCTSSVSLPWSLAGFALCSVKPPAMATLRVPTRCMFPLTRWRSSRDEMVVGEQWEHEIQLLRKPDCLCGELPFFSYSSFSFLWLPSALPLTTAHTTFSGSEE